MIDPVETSKTRRRYDRIAWLFDFMERPVESRRFAAWRGRLAERIKGPRVLEVGVGTGKNMPYYPAGVEVTAIDLSPRMLAKARAKAEQMNLNVDLQEMDAQVLEFPDRAFDTVFATFVFCSVPDPVLGLAELRRVTKPGGRLLLLEHMRPDRKWAGFVFDFFNPLAVRLGGENINRRTMDNIRAAGWQVEIEEHLSSDVVRLIQARP